MQDELKPVAWLYQCGKSHIVKENDDSGLSGYTKTPLYAHPPTTNPVAVSETPVGDHQMVEAVDRVLIEAIINDYHTTRLDRDYVPHILSKPRTVEAFARHRQSALTAARAQVDKFRHVKRGTIYEVIGTAELQIANTRYTPGEGDLLVVYRGEDGKMWCREEGEFHDGRFAFLAAGEHRKDAP